MTGTISTGNVYADLGFKDADKRMAKADLAIQIGKILSDRGLTQMQAAKILGIPQSHLSNLVRGRLEGFSMDHLFRLLNALGQRVHITVEPAEKNDVGTFVECVPFLAINRY
ncbi:helix-turn-helix domain-containing protein [Magnetococcales bacterium HHB-1]